MLNYIPGWSLIKWGAFIVALICLVGFLALYFSCEEAYNSDQNIGWDYINPLYWGEQGGCAAGKETTKWVGSGAAIVFGIMYALQWITESKKSDDYYYDD